MKNFHDLEKDWQNQSLPSFDQKFEKIKNKNQSKKANLEQQMLFSSIGLSALTAFFAWIGYSFLIESKVSLSVSAIILCILCIIQTIINLSNWLVIKGINETFIPKENLQQWQKYYQRRLFYFKSLTPIFFILLNAGFIISLPEVLGKYPNISYQIGFTLVYISIMVFFWRNVGKTMVKKELIKLQTIIQDFQQKEASFTEE